MAAVLGIILIVAGAIAAFAIDTGVDGVDLRALGFILMAAGALALLVAAIQGAGWMAMGKRRVRSERHVAPDGQHVVEQTEIR